MDQLLICENEQCGKLFLRRKYAISKRSYCSQSCAAKVNNILHPKRTAPDIACASCGTVFRKGIKKVFCSVKCRHIGKQKHTAQHIREEVKNIAMTLGRSPSRRELGAMAYAAIRQFGSWNALLREIGLSPHRSHDHRMYRRSRTRAKDGHNCDSISEAIIDNWLSQNNIQHERDARYPSTRHRADWRVGNVFIEYFGLAQDSPRYDRTVQEKKRICRESGIALIEVYPSDLYPRLTLDSKLATLK